MLVEYRELEQLKDYPDRFLKALDKKLKNLGPLAALRALKASGVLVDLYDQSKYQPIRERSIELLQSRLETHDFEALRQDLELFGVVIRAFRDLQAERGLDDIAPKRKVSAFLLALEFALGSLRMYRLKNDVLETKRVYPFVILPASDEGIAKATDAAHHIADTADAIAESAGLVLKSMISDLDKVDPQDTIATRQARQSREHLHLAGVWRTLTLAKDIWEFYDSHLVREDDQIRLEILDRKAYEAREVSNARTIVKQNTLAYSAMPWNTPLIDESSSVLPPNAFRNKQEMLAALACYEIFGSELLEEEILGVPLSHWVRAYTVISAAGAAAADGRTRAMPLLLREWLVLKSEEEWCRILTDSGLTSKTAPLVLDALSFKQLSRDLLDAPLIRVAQGIAVVPSLVAIINAPKAMLSNFMRLRANVEFKGKGFEEVIRKNVCSAGVPCKELNTIEGEQQYQCDGAFVIDDHLYFLEMKSLGYPFAPREHYNVMLSLEKAAAQLNRIADFYVKELHHVRNALNLPPQWEPLKVVKLVVCSAMLGEALEIEGCHVIDASAFGRFWDREPPGVTLDGETYVDGHTYHVFTGPVTSSGLLDAAADPPQISFIRMLLREYRYEVHDLGACKFAFPVIDRLPDYAYLTKAQVEIMKANLMGLPGGVPAKGQSTWA